MGIRSTYSVRRILSYTDGNEQQHRQFISLPATVMVKDRIQSCVWCLQKSRVPFSWSNSVFCILYRVTVASPIPCHAYADTIPILSPGEDRKHHDWCHAVSPSTCLGTWQKYILSNMKHAHFIHYKVQDCSQSQTQYPKFQPCSSWEEEGEIKSKKTGQERDGKMSMFIFLHFSKVVKFGDRWVGLRWIRLSWVRKFHEFIWFGKPSDWQ